MWLGLFPKFYSSSYSTGIYTSEYGTWVHPNDIVTFYYQMFYLALYVLCHKHM